MDNAMTRIQGKNLLIDMVEKKNKRKIAPSSVTGSKSSLNRIIKRVGLSETKGKSNNRFTYGLLICFSTCIHFSRR
jgi:hypothetical protein